MLALKKFDLKNNCWDAATEVHPVVYRNTLLERLFPNLDIAIGDVSGYVKNDSPDLDGATAALERGFEGYKIVGASGSRKKGYALFVKNNDTDCFSRFFGSASNSINYGSNLVTECKATYEMSVTILVVKDGEFGTGDCHGKCSSKFALGVVGQLQRPFQFRAAVKDKYSWVAKGTLAFAFDCGGYDLVLPESCFKGNKVKPGVYEIPTLYFGVVHEAEVRSVKMSYSVTQYLPWEAVEADILPGTLAQAHKLVHLQSNTRELARFLLADAATDCEPGEEKDDDQYVSPLAEIVEADVHGQLIEHPWVVRKVKQLVRKRWIKLATAGAVQFQSAMTMPDDTLPDNTVCIPHLPEGDVIVFPYPCRWKWDLKVWQNRHTGVWSRGYEGIIAGNTQTMLSLGRDFDGDMLQFLPSALLPNVATAVRSFGEPPALEKPKKQKVEGSLASVAVRSMDNQVGLITFLIAKAWATGNHHLIPRLAQELQIEVDSLKNVQRADREYLAAVGEGLKSHKVLWLTDHKEESVFSDRVLKVSGNGTISRLATAVNAIWQQFTPKERALNTFRDLFPANFSQSWRERATLRRDQYRNSMKAAITSNDVRSRRAPVEAVRGMSNAIPAHMKQLASAAFWHVCHVQKSGTASMVFHAFLPEIKEQLKEQRFAKLTITGIKYGDFGEYQFQGEERCIIITESKDERYKGRLEAMIGRQRLGMLAADSFKYPAGSVLTVSLTSGKGSVVAQVSELVEFDF